MSLPSQPKEWGSFGAASKRRRSCRPPWLAARRGVARTGAFLAIVAALWLVDSAVLLGEAGKVQNAVLPNLPYRDRDTTVISEFAGDRVLVEYYHNSTKRCESWVLLPAENMWGRGLRGLLYLLALVYTLTGIALISDIFMAGIEKITSHKEIAKVDTETGETRTMTVVVWNETVANLTLLALGSSAPEILLSLIETILTLDEAPGELGASTIVGSAAFNLLCITAVCMWVTPKNKCVKQFGVFAFTTAVSFFAYIWMCIVLLGVSKCKVEMWEAVLTLAFFPILVIVAYLQDRRWFCTSSDVDVEQRVLRLENEDGSAALVTELWRKLNNDPSLSPEEAEVRLAALAEAELGVGFSKAAYRMGAVKLAKRQREELRPLRQSSLHAIGGGGGVGESPCAADAAASGNTAVSRQHTASTASTALSPRARTAAAASGAAAASAPDACVLQWSAASYTVMENEGIVRLAVVRSGPSAATVTARYRSRDGSAKAGVRYEARAGHVVVEAGKTRAVVEVPIIDDKQFQADEVFSVVLEEAGGGARVGDACEASVVIVDDDIPGLLELAVSSAAPAEGCGSDRGGSDVDTNGAGEAGGGGEGGGGVRVETEEGGRLLHLTAPESVGFVSFDVVRRIGTDGNVTVALSVEPGTAQEGTDYTVSSLESGVLCFAHGESSKTVTIAIVDHMEYSKEKDFYVALGNPESGASLGPVCRGKVTITEDASIRELINRVVGDAEVKKELVTAHLEQSSWREQFRRALTVEGSGEDGEPPCLTDYAVHLITLFWRVLFATVPPTSYGGGWATFCCALGFIAVVTAVVAELASLFGCVVGLRDPVTAITLVALGTSLPDTFASMTAIEVWAASLQELTADMHVFLTHTSTTQGEECADAAIGNVMGSNSVNVFLGLGLPWLLASIYKEAKGEPYVYPAGDLVFSVVLFLICAMIAVAIMIANRVVHGGELGGPQRRVFACILAALWVCVPSLLEGGFLQFALFTHVVAVWHTLPQHTYIHDTVYLHPVVVSPGTQTLRVYLHLRRLR